MGAEGEEGGCSPRRANSCEERADTLAELPGDGTVSGRKAGGSLRESDGPQEGKEKSQSCLGRSAK